MDAPATRYSSKGERIYYQRRLHSKRWGNNIGRYGQEDRAVGSLNQALPANPVHGRKILLIVFLFYTLHLIASGNLNHIQQNKMILGAWVHQELEQQMPSSDIPSKILCQVIKIDLQDMQQQTPCQQLIAKDLHGNEWNFQHVNQSELPSKARQTKISSTSNSCHGGFPVIISITMQPRDQISKAGDISASFTDSGDMYKGVPRKVYW
ncbi:hypothetical protein GH714_001772 [Hevea brasiliensis]|uniref:Uncharacterized protein n=1 Tax=Hevea brasiliensis TaxID=3981 RepID=A0A6A6MBM4_HEVBR|nr:hypothetical protein GH714_001772 [Hevea brasiliensis]